MIVVKPADRRGRTRTDWLDSRHSFSFAEYYDPEAMGFRTLRVLNDDRVKPGAGFGTHGHRDMEIVSYVVAGALEHKDSMGTGSVLGAGTVQRMTAGTGVLHSEWNHSKSDPVRFLQIWILPNRRGLAPGYEERAVWAGDADEGLRLIASRDAREDSLAIHQDAAVWAGRLAAGGALTQAFRPGRHAWLQIVRGALTAGGQDLAEGDGAAISDERELTLVAREAAEFLLFDLA